MPLGVAIISQTSSSWAASESLESSGHTVPPESCHIIGGRRSLDIRRNFKTEEQKGDEPSKEPGVQEQRMFLCLKIMSLVHGELGVH